MEIREMYAHMEKILEEMSRAVASFDEIHTPMGIEFHDVHETPHATFHITVKFPEDEEHDPEAEAERRYFNMMDPAYQRDLRTPFEDTLEYDSMMYDDRDYPEWGE